MNKFKLLFVAASLFLLPFITAAQASKIPLQCSDTSGSGTAQVCTTGIAMTPTSGDAIIYKTTTQNSGDVTLAINGGSAIHFRKWSGQTILSKGDIQANVPILTVFDGTFWEIGGWNNTCQPSANYICAAQPAAGAGIDTVLNPCITAAIAVSGTCDARGLPPTANIAATNSWGDSGGDSVTLLVPPICLWTPTITNNTDAVQWWGGAKIISEGPDGYASCYIENASGSTSISHLMLGQGVSGINTFGTVKGIKFYVAPGASATTSGIGVLIEGFQDLTSFDGSAVIDQVDPIGAEFLNNCCNMQVKGSFFGANSATGVTPLVLANTSGQSQGIHFSSVNVDAPGATFPNIKCTDTFIQNSWYDFDGLYEETNATDTTTTVNQVAGCGNVYVHGNRISTKAGSWAGKGWSFSSSGHGSWHVDGGITISPGGTPSIVVTNSNTNTCPKTPCLSQTSTAGWFDVSSVFTCTSAASPAVCASAEEGEFVIASGAATVTVNTTEAPTDEADISISELSSATSGTRLGVTCNTVAQPWTISAVTPQTSFTLTVPSNFSTNPGCFSFRIRKH